MEPADEGGPSVLPARAVPFAPEVPLTPEGEEDWASVEVLEETPDWRSYLELGEDTRRCRRWVSAGRPGLIVPFVETSLTIGSVGCAVWKTASVLAEYLLLHADKLFAGGEAMLEVGCGCGLPGIAALAATWPGLSRAVFADLVPLLAELACGAAAAALRANGAPAGAVELGSFGFNWSEEPETWGGDSQAFHVVFASDANDQQQRKPAYLARAFDRYARRQGAVVIDANPDMRADLPEFREVMVRNYGFKLSEPSWSRDLEADPPVHGLTAGERRVTVDVYRR